MTSKTFADLDPEVFGPLLTRTEPIRTLDDMHDSELHEILQWAADNLPALHEADEHGHLGWYSDNELAQRRKAIVRFDAVTLPRLKRAIHTVHRAPWLLLWLPRPHRALYDLMLFAEAVLDKIQVEDATRLEQFGPIKRAAEAELRD